MFFTDKVNTLYITSVTEMDECLDVNVLQLLTKCTEGFTVGLRWPDKWKSHPKPGGPWVYGGGDKEAAKQSLLENNVWIIGYDAGRQLNP